MKPSPITRRTLLERGSRFVVAAAAAGVVPPLLRAQEPSQLPPGAVPAPSPPGLIQNLRQAGSTTPVQTTKLRDTLFLMQGVGGNVVAQVGPDGKLLIDSSVATAAPHLREALDKVGVHPLKLLINTHWHFDHTDGNAAMHDAGAFIVAHESTRIRLSQPQEIKLFQAKFAPSPNSALPQMTFQESEKLYLNNDEIDLVHTPAAHTDSDIYIFFHNANVLHTGDLWFNGNYPFIDDGTGGTINGMIRGVDQCLALVDEKTKIVPGHGPAGDKEALSRYRDMLATAATAVERLKSGGQTLQQTIAARPTAGLDATWGKGDIKPDTFVTLLYNTLP